jgi:hypothetical protein
MDRWDDLRDIPHVGGERSIQGFRKIDEVATDSLEVEGKQRADFRIVLELGARVRSTHDFELRPRLKTSQAEKSGQNQLKPGA